MSYPPVNSKKDFVKRYKNGEFGNASPTWNDLKSFLDEGRDKDLTGLYHLRNRVKGGPTWYNVSGGSVRDKWAEVHSLGQVTEGNLYVSEMCPTHKTQLVGEVTDTPDGLTLYASTLPRTMREALASSSFTVRGLPAVGYLRMYLNANSYEWMHELLDRYPGHVIEFTALSRCWGTLPGFNTVFWEVRNY